MKKLSQKLSLCLGVVLTAVSSITYASSGTSYTPEILLDAGTQGVGLELVQPLSSAFTLSLQGNYFKYSHSFSSGDGTYDGHLKFLNGGLLVNYHPFFGAFKLSGGAYYNANKIEGDVDTSSSGANAIADGDVNVKYKKIAPYAGLGWDWGHTVIVALDLGVMFEGKPNVTFDNGCSAACASQQEDIQSKFNDYTKYYPVIRLGVGF